MKSKLSSEDVVAIFERLKSEAVKYADAGKFEDAIGYIRLAAQWAYCLNFKYYDAGLESLIKRIARICLPQIKINSEKNKFVFINTEGHDNRGLTQQYLRAIMAQNTEILYISVEGYNSSEDTDIQYELNSYGKATTLYGAQLGKDNISKSKGIIEAIKNYNPEKIILHLMPWDTVSLLAIGSIDGPLKYNINLTDHAFWLGASFIDYNFEFRPFGRTISIEKREMKDRNLLHLPYYPVFPKVATGFKGFPELPERCIKIFTGGSFYKMLDNEGTFFRIMDSLLSISPYVFILIAGSGSMGTMRKNIEVLHNKNRILYIGDRKDINEVFRHCDIFLDTYPIQGGLMEGFACANSKPILMYSDFSKPIINRSEKGDKFQAYSDIDNMLKYAKKLILDETFRRQEGDRNRQFVYTPDIFNSNFARLISDTQLHVDWEYVDINYSKWRKHYLELENQYLHSGIKLVINKLRLKVFSLFPQYIGIFIATTYKVLLEILSSWSKRTFSNDLEGSW